MKYKTKPCEIEAYQTDKEMIIHTLEGDMKASVGDYIITGLNGEQYPCKPDIFEKKYERADKLTNYDRIRNMSIEEMAGYFADVIGWDCNNCSEHERLADNPLMCNESCDNQCEIHCREWLKK